VQVVDGQISDYKPYEPHLPAHGATPAMSDRIAMPTGA
jgi:hypothetical protein